MLVTGRRNAGQLTESSALPARRRLLLTGDLHACAREILAAFGESARAPEQANTLERQVSTRELEVLRLLAEQLTNDEVAER